MSHKARVLELLSDGRPHGHMEGYRLGVMLHSRVADLRKDGHTIECWHENGGYWYRLALEATDPPLLGDGRITGSVASSAPDMAAAAEDGALEIHPAQLTLGVAA